MIPVTKPYFPTRSRLDHYISRIYQTNQLTNQGPLVLELTERLQDYLGVDNLLLVANGTLALQIAFETLGVRDFAVTTPFTFPATSSALVWQNTSPLYARVLPDTLNLDPAAVESLIGSERPVSAIVPVHTYGSPCDVEAFERIRMEHDLPVIYDASHCFGVTLNGESLLSHGTAATLSFHATKIFHTAEGGAIVFRDAQALERARQMINFGLAQGTPAEVGINAKMSELHAAMGLAVLDDIEEVIERRVEIKQTYQEALSGLVDFPGRMAGANENGAYMPVLFQDKAQRDRVYEALKEQQVESRRYFSPSLDSTGLYSKDWSNLAEPFCSRILCLPIYYGLASEDVQRIAGIVKASL